MNRKRQSTYRLFCSPEQVKGSSSISEMGKAGCAAVVFFALALFMSSCKSGTRIRQIKGTTMGTYYIVAYRGGDDEYAIKPIVEELLSEIDGQLSNWDPNSWISRFNRSPQDRFVPIPNHACRVLKQYHELHEQTGGALDPTLGSLISLWGFGPEKVSSLPSSAKLREALLATGSDKIRISCDSARIARETSGLQLNLSAVAKGYAADQLAQYLRTQGISNYLVNIGGDMRAAGYAGDGSAWQVGIQRPNPGEHEGHFQTTIDLENAALATSGDYRRYRKDNEQRYPHILDPKTGQPVQTNLASVSILAPTAARADGWATASMVLGIRKASELLEGISAVEGLFIERTKPDKFRSTTTSGWSRATFQRKNRR